MNTDYDATDEENLSYEVADEVLEAAANIALYGRPTIGCPTPSVGWSCPVGPAVRQ
jgi:hypothetical protein